MTSIMPKVIQNVDPARWREHRFGLTPERWQCMRNKSFWITGAGTGYGRCLAVALTSTGAMVFLTGRRREKLVESLEEMRSLSIPIENCHLIEADITDNEQVTMAFNTIKTLCSSLYGLVNNAAIPPREGVPCPLQEESLENWDRMMRTNVTAPWLLTRGIFPHMKKGGMVRVLFVTSEAGWGFAPGAGHYNVSKAALNSLTGSMAEEYAVSFPDVDIQMNAIVPGQARTEMNQGSTENPYSVVSMALVLLSFPKGGPNGKFFHRDGRHLQFCYSKPYKSRRFRYF